MRKTHKQWYTLRWMIILAVLPAMLMLSGCEQIFTYSPLTWAQRDPANLSTEGKIAYATGALSSDTATMQSAFDAIVDIDDPDVQYLASQLAVGASGINDAIDNMVTALDAGVDPATIDAADILADLDQTYLQGAGSTLAAAEAGGVTVSDTDYILAAASLVLSSAITGGGDQAALDTVISSFPDPAPASYDPGQTDAENAAYFLSQTTTDITDIDSLLAMFNP